MDGRGVIWGDMGLWGGETVGGGGGGVKVWSGLGRKKAGVELEGGGGSGQHYDF
jgi:hypothetical protein